MRLVFGRGGDLSPCTHAALVAVVARFMTGCVLLHLLFSGTFPYGLFSFPSRVIRVISDETGGYRPGSGCSVLNLGAGVRLTAEISDYTIAIVGLRSST